MNYFFWKCLADRTFSFLMLALLSPVLSLVLILCSFDTKSLGLFFQERVGYKKRTFILVKFKTMVDIPLPASSDSGIACLSAARITSFGKWLRRFKVDELPQLYNILVGQMSFVGPRPDIKLYADKVSLENSRIFSVLPGVTSFASLKYRNEEQLLSNVASPDSFYDEKIWPDKILLNLCYVRQMSFLTDIQLLARTFFASIRISND